MKHVFACWPCRAYNSIGICILYIIVSGKDSTARSPNNWPFSYPMIQLLSELSASIFSAFGNPYFFREHRRKGRRSRCLTYFKEKNYVAIVRRWGLLYNMWAHQHCSSGKLVHTSLVSTGRVRGGFNSKTLAVTSYHALISDHWNIFKARRRSRNIIDNPTIWKSSSR